MFWQNNKKNNNKQNKDMFEKSSQNQTQKNAANPFSENNYSNFHEVWENLKKKTEELDKQCYPNTYVWIEKFKDDN